MTVARRPRLRRTSAHSRAVAVSSDQADDGSRSEKGPPDYLAVAADPDGEANRSAPGTRKWSRTKGMHPPCRRTRSTGMGRVNGGLLE